MIFPSIRMDSVVQVDDLFRVDLGNSSTSDGSDLTKIELAIGLADPVSIYEPEAEKHNKFIDWQFDSEGEKELTFLFTHGLDTRSVTKKILVKTAAEEKLFSNDEMLIGLEPDIYDLLPAGRSSFIYVHRMAQEKIMRELVEDGHEVNLSMLIDVKEVSFWSRYMVLAYIFESNITSENDIHTLKRDKYSSFMDTAKSRSLLSLDKDEDGEADTKILKFPTTLVRA